MIIRKFIIMICLVLGGLIASAQYPSYVIILDRHDTIPENNVAGYNGAHIIFPCNKTYFNHGQESWLEVKQVIGDILGDSTLSLDKIHMYGAASPEGPYKNNVYLSINRANRVINSLDSVYPGIREKIEYYNVPEDYERLIYVTREDSLYQDIAKYIGDNDFITKKQLQANPTKWKDLLKRYYPGLRAVNILIYVRKIKIDHIVIVPDIPLLPIDPPDIVIPPIIPVQQITVCEQLPMLRLKTNLLYDALVVPNWSVEFLPKHSHITPEFKMMWAGWRNDNKFRTWIIHSYELGGRYYFKEKYTGWFVNCAVGLGVYDIQLGKQHGCLSKKYQYNNKFEIGCGYVHKIKSNWTIEYTIGLGCIYSKHDKYHGAESWATPGQFYYNWHLQPEIFNRYNNRFMWFGPVNVGISISYDLIHYKKQCEPR